jgi:biotin transport system substrate-specific component
MNSVAAPTSAAVPRSPSALLRFALAVVVGSLLVAICAHISIPLWFTPVPLTLQTFAVLLLGLLLPPGVAAATLVLYLIEGASGFPVFSPQGPGGVLQLFGPTAGYLLAYPFAAALTAVLRTSLRRFGRGAFTAALLSSATGSAVILIAGATWLAILKPHSPGSLLALSVLPFLPGDVLKVTAAAATATALRRWSRF